jgi:hypothetical protein
VFSIFTGFIILFFSTKNGYWWGFLFGCDSSKINGFIAIHEKLSTI